MLLSVLPHFGDVVCCQVKLEREASLRQQAGGSEGLNLFFTSPSDFHSLRFFCSKCPENEINANCRENCSCTLYNLVALSVLRVFQGGGGMNVEFFHGRGNLSFVD